MVIIALVACVPEMEDNSLEAVQVSDVYDEANVEASGPLAAAAGAGEGDWSLTVGEQAWSYHSPSHVDFAELDGVDVSASAAFSYTGSPSFTLTDGEGLRFVTTSDDDGARYFGRSLWKLGDVIGRGVIDEHNGEQQEVRFTDVSVAADDGEVRVLPGEPTSLTIDGARWRLTVIAAYEPENPKHSKCGAPDMLSVELVRTDVEPGEPLVRPAGRFAPLGS